MKKEKYLTFIVCMIRLTTAQTLFAVNECTTPRNESGVCIHITSCPTLLKILQHRIETKSIEDYDFLKKSYCGFEVKTVKACCPLNDTSSDYINVSEDEDSTTEDKDYTSRSLPKSTCGKIAINRDKIVGGNKAELGYWPWIAAIGYQYVNRKGVVTNDPLQWLCAGSLITDRHVLTAAHCVNHNSSNSNLVVVRLGEVDLNPNVADGANPIDIFIERSFVHPGYSTVDNTNDIAILRLNQSVTYNKFIQPICLLSMSDMNNVNTLKIMPYVAGWGSINSNPKNDKTLAPTRPLMEVQIPIVNITECNQNYAHQKSVIDDRVICAGYQKGGKDSCRGDSGGPLMWPKKEQYFLLGIVSYGNKICGKPNSPGVYTKVSNYIDWIEDQLKIF